MTADTRLPSLLRRREIMAALRTGTVPRRGVEVLATGLERYVTALDEELDRAAQGHGVFKAVRGDYGTGKTFFARWLAHRALGRGFAVAEVQINETETPLHHMGTVYRRAMESLRTAEWEEGAFRSLVGRWFYSLEEEVLARPDVARDDAQAVAKATGELLEQRLARVTQTNPSFAAALRACHRARVEGDTATAEGLLAWLMGQPNVGAAIKRAAAIKGEIDHDAAGAFLRGLLVLLGQTGRKGFVLVLDEAETIQRMRGDVRERSLNALRQFLDDRGGHLAAVLERLTRIAVRDLQRVALSATVGNPEAILDWLRGSSKRSGRVLRAPGVSAAPELVLDALASEGQAAVAAARLFRGEKRLFFVESRRAAEAMASALGAQEVSVFVTHASLSADARAQAERAFAEARDCVIVATSALELGIDVGDLDRVLQLDSPTTVASFLQRMGRSGRRAETRANCNFLTTDPAATVQAAALLRLHRAGYVEPVRAPSRAAHLLAHQLMALSIQRGGIAESDAWAWVAGAAPFRDLTESDYRALIEHMLAKEILHRDGGLLSLGAEGEKRYGRRNFAAAWCRYPEVCGGGHSQAARPTSSSPRHWSAQWGEWFARTTWA